MFDVSLKIYNVYKFMLYIIIILLLYNMTANVYNGINYM